MRKICVFTGTRAEYGLLRPLMDRIKTDKALKLQILASGAHLSSEFGSTFREIERDGFKINAKIKILSGSDTSVQISKAIGLGVIGYSRVYERLKPDILVVLGDRYEALAAAVAAMVARIPIAHVQGGEATYGMIDEAIRHAITKMSYWHFAATQEAYRRIIQLGEDPGRVFLVGALGIDNIRNLKLLSQPCLEEDLGFRFGKRNLLVTFHPVTLEHRTAKHQFAVLLSVLDKLKDTNLIFTKANADLGGRSVNKMIDEYVARNRRRAVVFASMGQLRYLSTMRLCDAVVGNSSSGIIEAPTFKIGTINIGDRQAGRVRAKSTIDCLPTKESIKTALCKLYSTDFQRQLRTTKNPYGEGRAASQIVNVLRSNRTVDIKKRFYDLPLRDIKG